MTGPPNPPPAGGGGKDVASAKKRRRRAPAGGAADDCFTCAKRGVKCDRKRPYCSQCLEIGNDCSGYKTQLTWGVGVASRGKLRGLSLPVAKSAPVQPAIKKSPTRSRAGSTATAAQWSEQDDPMVIKEDIDMHSEATPSAPITHYNPYEMSVSSPHHQQQQQQQQQHAQQEIASPTHTQAVPHSPWGTMQFQVSLPENDAHRFQPMSLPGSGAILPSPMDTISEVDYMSPLSHSFPRDDHPYMQNQSVMFESYHSQSPQVDPSPVSAMMIEQPPRPPTACPSLIYGTSEPSSSSLHSHSHLEDYSTHLDQKLLHNCDGLARTPDLDTYSTSVPSHAPFWASSIPEEDEEVSHSMIEHSPPPWPTHFAPQLPPVSAELIAKMPFFMDYYENTMCPSMVFIDGPNNPFRDHILQLAASSRSLQHAICALAACNLRMKRKLSLGQHGRDNIGEKRLDSVSDAMSDAPPEDQSLTEEYQHRNLAVHLLNEQLNDTDKSRHDSVLATILLLCHYRMAESGVAKFHTQFAGVKKILGMRRSSLFPPSRDSAWMEAIFTYFDAISASINNREAQLSTHFYGLPSDANILPPGAENLVGCDRELFKTIIKLGRLNLLSQHRPVQNATSPTLARRPSRAQSPLDIPLGHSYRSSRPPLPHQMSADAHMFPHHNRYTSSGFGNLLNDDDVMTTHGLPSASTAYDEHRELFWREWKDARLALQSWEFDSQRVMAGLLPGIHSGPSGAFSPGAGLQSPTMPGAHMHGMSLLNQHNNGQPNATVTPSQVRDLSSLSEAFRYAALLYTERLASPNVPSSHSNFRNLVSQVVYYATSLESGSNAEKFLLWPLFVAGSECVNELQQNIVRSKCRDIMSRSGYMNNLAALDVLESLWASDWREESKTMNLMRRGPFSWTKCIGGPDVEVEWIMF